MSNLTNFSDLDQQSILELSALVNRIAWIGWMTFGCIGMVTNGLILSIIFCTKSLHNRSQYAVASFIFAEFFQSFVRSCYGVRMYLYYFFQWSDVHLEKQCIAFQVLDGMSMGVAWNSGLLLGVDRLLALSAPIFYKTVSTRKYLIIFNAITWSYSCVKTFVEFLVPMGDGNAVVTVCTYSHFSEASSNIAPITGVITYAVILATVVVYVSACIVVACKLWGKTKTVKSQMVKDLQLKTFVSMIVIGGTGTMINGISFSLIILSTSTGLLRDILPYLSIFGNVNMTTHLPILIIVSDTYRRAFCLLLRCKDYTEVTTLL